MCEATDELNGVTKVPSAAIEIEFPEGEHAHPGFDPCLIVWRR